MLQYIVRRLLLPIPTLFAISIVSFVLIQLPPGDFLSSYAATLAQQGESGSAPSSSTRCRRPTAWTSRSTSSTGSGSRASSCTATSGCRWSGSCRSRTLIWERMGGHAGARRSSTLIFTWLLAIPIGVFSATHQYSKLDYLFTFLGFIGLGIPSFMIALVLMWVAFRYFGQDVGGLFSPRVQNAPWSVGKVLDLLGHFWLPLLILGPGGHGRR